MSMLESNDDEKWRGDQHPEDEDAWKGHALSFTIEIPPGRAVDEFMDKCREIAARAFEEWRKSAKRREEAELLDALAEDLARKLYRREDM